MNSVDRLTAFEKMLSDILENQEKEKQSMDKLKAQGKEKTATYRQYMGNRLMYNKMVALYKEYGLVEKEVF